MYRNSSNVWRLQQEEMIEWTRRNNLWMFQKFTKTCLVISPRSCKWVSSIYWKAHATHSNWVYSEWPGSHVRHHIRELQEHPFSVKSPSTCHHDTDVQLTGHSFSLLNWASWVKVYSFGAFHLQTIKTMNFLNRSFSSFSLLSFVVVIVITVVVAVVCSFFEIIRHNCTSLLKRCMWGCGVVLLPMT